MVLVLIIENFVCDPYPLWTQSIPFHGSRGVFVNDDAHIIVRADTQALLHRISSISKTYL